MDGPGGPAVRWRCGTAPASAAWAAGPRWACCGRCARQAALQVGGPVLWVLVFLSGVYGGYFGAAQGVLLLGHDGRSVHR